MSSTMLWVYSNCCCYFLTCRKCIRKKLFRELSFPSSPYSAALHRTVNGNYKIIKTNCFKVNNMLNANWIKVNKLWFETIFSHVDTFLLQCSSLAYLHLFSLLQKCSKCRNIRVVCGHLAALPFLLSVHQTQQMLNCSTKQQNIKSLRINICILKCHRCWHVHVPSNRNGHKKLGASF